MIQYEVCLNQGNEALQTGKSITANEVLLTCDEKALARAKELDPTVTDITMENAGELATRAGVTVKVRCESEVKFSELLEKEGYSVERKGVVERAYVNKKAGDDTNPDDNTQQGGGDNTGGDNGGGGNTPDPLEA